MMTLEMPICRLCGEFREGPHCCLTAQKSRIEALTLANRKRLAEARIALDVAAFSDAPTLHAAALNFAAALLCVEGEAWHAETAKLLWKLAKDLP